MAHSASAAQQISRRYASALIDTAEGAKALESVEKNVTELVAMIDSSVEFKNFLMSPVYSVAMQDKTVESLAQKSGFHQLMTNFLKVIVNNKRLSILPVILSVFKDELAKRRGEVKASVVSAFALSPEQERALQDTLKKSLGFKVHLDVSVDNSLLGGMVVTIGSRMIDDSVKTKLERLKLTMTTSNQNTHLKEVG